MAQDDDDVRERNHSS